MNWQTLPFNPEHLEEGECYGFEVNGQALFLVKKHKEIYCYRNRCPHQGINLEWQANIFLDFDKNLIQCASHGALFTIKGGRCIAGPCAGQALDSINYRCDPVEGWQLELPSVNEALPSHEVN